MLSGASDYGLRLLPLASSLVALGLFYHLAKRALVHPAAVCFALTLFALQPELIRYAAQVKPYAVDLAVALALTLLADFILSVHQELPRPSLYTRSERHVLPPLVIPSVSEGPGGRVARNPLTPEVSEASPRPGPSLTLGMTEPRFSRGNGIGWSLSPSRALLVGVAGTVAVFLSHAAVLVLAGLAAALLLGFLLAGRRREIARLGITIGCWAVSCGAAVWVASREMTPRMHDILWQYWMPTFGPRPHTVIGDVRWAISTLAGELGDAGLAYPFAPLYLGLAALGAIAHWRRNRSLSLLLLAPIATALAAADLHLYPFGSRVVLFVVPALMLAVAAGVETLAATLLKLARRQLPKAGAALLYLVALVPALLAFRADPPVYRIEETKPLLQAVAERRQPGDAIYVYYGAGHALRFYGPRYGFQPGDYELGGCHRGDARKYLVEVDGFRGRPRLWVLIAHAQPRLGEDQLLLAYLDRLGTRRLALRALPHVRGGGLPAEAFLYDLTDAKRSTASAATFPIPPAPSGLDPRLACAGAANPVPATP